jgi:hypothetical protein
VRFARLFREAPAFRVPERWFCRSFAAIPLAVEGLSSVAAGHLRSQSYEPSRYPRRRAALSRIGTWRPLFLRTTSCLTWGTGGVRQQIPRPPVLARGRLNVFLSRKRRAGSESAPVRGNARGFGLFDPDFPEGSHGRNDAVVPGGVGSWPCASGFLVPIHIQGLCGSFRSTRAGPLLTGAVRFGSLILFPRSRFREAAKRIEEEVRRLGAR